MLRTDNWAKITLDQVASLDHNSLVDGPFGSDLKMSEYTSAGVRLIQLQNIGEGVWIDSNQRFIPLSKFNDLSRHAAYPGDIAIAKMADPVARACIVPHVSEKFLVVADCIKLSVNLKRHNPRFIVRAINHLDFRRKAEDVSTGTTRQRINLSALRKIPLWVPSLTEQNYIANMFDDLDMQSQRTEQLITKLKQQREGLLHDLLTRGLDEDGELRDPDVHPELFKDSVLGRVPKEWSVNRLEKISSQIVDGTNFTPNYIKDGVPFLRVTDIQSDEEMSFDNVKKISKQEHQILIKRCKPEFGDILYSKNGTVGIPKLIDWQAEFSIFVSLCLIKPITDLLASAYLIEILKSFYISQQIRIRSKQMTVVNLHLEEIKEFLIPVPNKNEQDRIMKIINGYNGNIYTEESHLAKLKHYKQGLMHDLLTGRVRVGIESSIEPYGETTKI
jgi:type I restriction enzyme S subunit